LGNEIPALVGEGPRKFQALEENERNRVPRFLFLSPALPYLSVIIFLSVRPTTLPFCPALV
jgi:hypothetical protein